MTGFLGNAGIAPATAETAAAAEEMLADLDLEGDDTDIMAGLSEEEDSIIEVLESKDAGVAEMASTATVTDIEEAPAPAELEKAPKVRKAKGAAAPRMPRDLNAIGDEHFSLYIAGTNPDKATVIGMIPKQKKIAEKFENLFAAISIGKSPSVYVMQCFAMLDEKKTVTSADLVAGLCASNSRAGKPYDDGTARSQTGQIMALFDVVGIAKRSGNVLTLNTDSAIAAKLRTIGATVAPSA